ncbi:LPO_1073/Vpar_1526 family protein [Nocardia salmonicida]|uniref:LPO_1073/Vpar_1526 family protein n=1 Tax=Nocardia salmonicida TaxID=53431 RepID=UPI0033C8AEB9
MADRNSQRAGDNSNQTFIGTQVIGITESRATEIAREQAEIAVREKFVTEAQVTASRRIAQADRKIIAKLTALELLDIFGEPSFLSAFQKAQISAAQSEREDDYEILADLLVQRAVSGSSSSKAAIIRAIEIVDLVDERALHGLTALWFVGTTTPASVKPIDALNTVEAMYSSILPDDLPRGTWWVDHLEALNLVRKDRTMRFTKYVELLLRDRPGWVCEGLEEAEMLQRLKGLGSLIGVEVSSSLFIPHEFCEGRYRYVFKSRQHAIAYIRKNLEDGNGDLNKVDWLGVEQHFEFLENTDNVCVEKLHEKILEDYPAVARIMHWWNDLEEYAGATHIGIALAYTNGRKHSDLNGLMSLEDTLNGVVQVDEDARAS